MFPTFPPCRALIAGGGAPEIEVACRLMEYSRTLTGVEAYCFRAFAEAMEVIPSTLAENAGLNPIAVVTELRNRHVQGEKAAGINVRKVSADRCIITVIRNNAEKDVCSKFSFVETLFFPVCWHFLVAASLSHILPVIVILY